MRANRTQRPKLLPQIGTPEDVIAELRAALARAENDETLAIGIVEIQREGETIQNVVGHDRFRHQLIASAVYLIALLMDD